MKNQEIGLFKKSGLERITIKQGIIISAATALFVAFSGVTLIIIALGKILEQ